MPQSLLDGNSTPIELFECDPTNASTAPDKTGAVDKSVASRLPKKPEWMGWAGSIST